MKINDIYRDIRMFCMAPQQDLAPLEAIMLEVERASLCDDACASWEIVQRRSGSQRRAGDRSLAILIGFFALEVAGERGLNRRGAVYFADWLTQAITGLSPDMDEQDQLLMLRQRNLVNMNAVAAQAATGDASRFQAMVHADDGKVWWEAYQPATRSVIEACRHAGELDEE